MSLFRKAPTGTEIDAVTRSIRQRLESKQKAAAEKAEAEAEAKQAAKQNLLAPKVTFTERGFKRFSQEQIEGIAEGWRKRYESYGDPEIKRLAEERLVAALTADGYAIPERTETDPLKAALLRRQAAKG